VPDDAATVQLAINTAIAGDSVAVRPSPAGSYNEHIVIDKQLVVLGGWDATFTSRDPSVYQTVIDGEGNVPCVVEFAPGLDGSTVLDGFFITGGLASAADNYMGGGVRCEDTSPTISNNEIYENRANFGAGIACVDNANPEITANNIHDNSYIVLSALAGSGIFCRRSSPSISANTICRNTGSGIRCDESAPTILGNYICENAQGAGVACLDGSDAEVKDNYFYQNRANYGGGMWIEDSSPLVEENVFDDNTVEVVMGEGGGAGMCVWATPGNSASPVVRRNTFKFNRTTVDGGGVICRGQATPLIEYNVFQECEADAGGAVLVEEDADCTLANNTFDGNSASQGGAILVRHNGRAVVSRNIVYGSPAGDGVACDDLADVTLTCNDVYGNLPSNYSGCAPGADDISEDPLFCGEATYPDDPYSLDTASPCAVRNSPCGELIGTRPAGCSQGVHTERATWGRVKAMFK
jgi:hypothetical protein